MAGLEQSAATLLQNSLVAEGRSTSDAKWQYEPVLSISTG